MSNPSQSAIQLGLGADALLRRPRGSDRSAGEEPRIAGELGTTSDSALDVRTRSSLRIWAAAYRDRRRLNRAFRRRQREFHQAYDACEYSPSAQRELQAIWDSRD
jgi:hypothetical protein